MLLSYCCVASVKEVGRRSYSEDAAGREQVEVMCLN